MLSKYFAGTGATTINNVLFTLRFSANGTLGCLSLPRSIRTSQAWPPKASTVSTSSCYFTSVNSDEATDPFRYSAGKWLRNDAAHQEARHICFNFDALCQRVVRSCPGADSISTVEKKEGGFNRVFIFTTNNERVVVAKLPFSNAGPRHLTTKSEIATIEFCW